MRQTMRIKKKNNDGQKNDKQNDDDQKNDEQDKNDQDIDVNDTDWENIDLNVAYQLYYNCSSEENLDLVVQKGKKLIGYFSRLYGRDFPFEDLIQVGTEGLLKAIKRFDRNSGAAFSTYAGSLIMGEIRHYIRKEKSYYQPKTVIALQNRVGEIIESELFSKGEELTFESLSKKINIKEDGISEVIRSGLVPFDDIDLSKIASAKMETFKLPIEDRIVLEQALRKLSLLQQKVINMLFFKDMTQQQTAEKLGINQRKVSRVLQESLDTLRKKMA